MSEGLIRAVWLARQCGSVLFRRPAEPIQFGDPGLHPDHYAKPGAVGDQIASRRG